MILLQRYSRLIERIPRKELLLQELKTGEHSRFIAEKLVGWDTKADLLQLVSTEVHDIKVGINRDRPELQR